MTTTVRHATPADCDAIAAAHLAGWMAAYRGVIADAFLDTLTLGTFAWYSRPKLETPEPGTCFLVAERAGGVVGFARAGPTRATAPTGDPLPHGFTSVAPAELYAVYLTPESFGTGAGTSLLRSVAAEMLRLGHRSMCVWVLNGNARALDWYTRRGAHPVAEAPITLGGVQYPQTALLWPNLSALHKP